MIVSDNGASFTGHEFKNFTEGDGITHLKTLPYHAASNGLAERAVQTVKTGLLKQPGKDLALKLCQFLLRYRSTPCETTGVSPVELMFKRSIRTPFHRLRPSTAEQALAKQQAIKERYEGSTRERTFAPEDKVHTKVGFEKEWAAATVKDVSGQIIDLELSDGCTCRRHLDNILRRREPCSALSRGIDTIIYMKPYILDLF